MNLITQEELCVGLPGELYRESYRELCWELWGELYWALGFPIHTDFRGYNTVCYK
jgi:hypothetical protein